MGLLWVGTDVSGLSEVEGSLNTLWTGIETNPGLNCFISDGYL